MKQYEITDAASYAAAVKKVNTKFYELRSKRKENYDLSIELSARITAYEERKKHQRYYKAWEKLPEHKRLAFEKQYEFELRKYRDAGEALQRWQDNGETIDYKGWQKALKYVSATIHNLFTAYLPAAKVRLRMTGYHFNVSNQC